MERLTNLDRYGHFYTNKANCRNVYSKDGKTLQGEFFENGLLAVDGEAINKLGKLEDLEQEIGIGIVELFSLPDKEIYSINPIDKTIFVEKVICVGIDKELKWCHLFVDKKVGEERYPVRYFTALNILWFLTKEQAEKKLEEMNAKD